MRILLAADGSKYTRRAAKHIVKNLARFAKSPKVEVLHVRPPLPYPGAAAYAGKRAVAKYEREESEAALAVAERVLDEASIPYRSSWVIGDIARQVGAYVKKNRIDLLVMGSHGHGAFKSLALGDTAPKLIASTKVPILIVR